jgi:hypothetical protein
MVFNYSGPTGFEQAASSFTNHEWLYAPFVEPPTTEGANATVYMLVHNEYHGFEHKAEGLCNASVMVKGRCWYNSVTLSVSHDGGEHFYHAAAPPKHLVAASPSMYMPNHRPDGAFSPSQIVTNPHDGYHYSFVRYSNVISHRNGVCSMRTKSVGDPSSWRFWTAGGSEGYNGQFVDPYTSTSGKDCSVIGNISNFSQPVPRYVPHLNLFIMVGYLNFQPPSPHTNHHFGISSAPNPWGPWSSPVPIPADVDPKRDGGNPRGLYPAILDPMSMSLNYDTLEGEDVYVYWVQGRNKTVVGAPDMARDLVRQPIRLVAA